MSEKLCPKEHDGKPVYWKDGMPICSICDLEKDQWRLYDEAWEETARAMSRCPRENDGKECTCEVHLAWDEVDKQYGPLPPGYTVELVGNKSNKSLRTRIFKAMEKRLQNNTVSKEVKK